MCLTLCRIYNRHAWRPFRHMAGLHTMVNVMVHSMWWLSWLCVLLVFQHILQLALHIYSLAYYQDKVLIWHMGSIQVQTLRLLMIDRCGECFQVCWRSVVRDNTCEAQQESLVPQSHSHQNIPGCLIETAGTAFELSLTLFYSLNFEKGK